MKIQIVSLAVAALCLAGATQISAQQPAAAPGKIVATIDASQTSVPVSPYEYGMFIEHIGSTMYSSLWAEMLDDRKFYFPIVSKDPDSQTQPQGNRMRMQLRKWRPVGPDEVVVMDKDNPFVGDQCPRIALDATTPHGIRQAGLALVNGKRYTGRIYLRGTPGARVKVALVWGTRPNDRQTVSIPALASTYKKYPITFTAGTGTTDAALEITGTGTGSFHIGTLSLMPADNIKGFRADTIPLIRQIKSGFWRYGGNYTSNLIWYHTIGDRDKRPPDWDNAWSAMQTNDLGMDEFMTLCKLIGVEPYISVNAGLGDSHSAAQQVEYMNGSASTVMGAQRAKNGHPEPYHVKFWNIGNEPWGSWQIGRTDLKYFMIKHNEFAKAMRAVDPSITLIASGLMLEDWYLTGENRAKYAGNLGPLYGSDVDWTGGTQFFFAIFLIELWRFHHRSALVSEPEHDGENTVLSVRRSGYRSALVMLLWVDLHPGFIAGLGLLFAYLLMEALEFVFPSRATALLRLRQAWPALAATVAVTLLNPFGYKIYKTSLTLAGLQPPRHGKGPDIWELQPMLITPASLTRNELAKSRQQLLVAGSDRGGGDWRCTAQAATWSIDMLLKDLDTYLKERGVVSLHLSTEDGKYTCVARTAHGRSVSASGLGSVDAVVGRVLWSLSQAESGAP